MKRFTFYLFALIFLYGAASVSSAPMYSASVTVYDQDGQPLAGVPVRLEVHTTTMFDFDIGTTDWTGSVYLALTADGFLDYMYVTITNQDYEILSSQGTYTETSNYLYPTFDVGLDINRNDVVDVWEMPLAQEFCPVLFQPEEDNGWHWNAPGVDYTLRPVPVEAMDLNGDDILDENDVRVRVRSHPDGDILIGDGYRMDEVYVWDAALGFIPYSSLYPEAVQRVNEVFGWVDGSAQMFFFLPHYQWASDNPSEGNMSWYGAWNDLYHEKWLVEGDPWYIYGTIYAFFERSGSKCRILFNMHFPFNAAANRHEGDWQGIMVELDHQDPFQANIVSVQYGWHGQRSVRTIPVAYSQTAAEALHSETFDGDGNSNPAFANKYFVIEGTHPVTFGGGRTDELGVEGWGSHAQYPCPGIWDLEAIAEEYVVENGSIYLDTEMFDFNNYQNIKIMPSKQYAMSNLTNDPTYSWVIFGGWWGNVFSYPSGEQGFFQDLLDGLIGFAVSAVTVGFVDITVIPDANIAAKSPYGGYYD